MRISEITHHFSEKAWELYKHALKKYPHGNAGYSSNMYALHVVYTYRAKYEYIPSMMAIAIMLYRRRGVMVFDKKHHYLLKDVVPDTFDQKGDWIEIDGGYLGMRDAHFNKLNMRELRAVTDQPPARKDTKNVRN